jgi:extracellular elastinolytic metalloproteinase
VSLKSMVSTLAATAVAGAGIAAAGVPAEQATQTARAHLLQQAHESGLSSSDLGDLAVSSVVPSRHNGVTHVYLQQRHGGIDVHGAIATVNVGADGRVISAGNRFVAGLAAAAGRASASKSAEEVVAAAAARLGLEATQPFAVLSRRAGADRLTMLSDGGIAARPIEAKLVWLPLDRRVLLTWRLEIEERSGAHWWYAFVDARSGLLVFQEDLVVQDSPAAIARAVARPRTARAAEATRSFGPTDGALYNVFPLPFESPSDGDRSLVENAADPDASPFGWHDTSGAAGPEFTVTRGNNVHAYADRDANNVADVGSDPDGGAALVFDFPLDLTLRPLDSQPAMVTNLFYWNNVMHDVTHGYGFDEAAGNFQVNNYGNGGLGGDDVRAEAQDGSGKNNANFGTGVEGLRPRMQMFEWRSSLPNPITVAPPSPIAGTYFGPMAGFGESLVTTGPITGTAVLANDGVGVTSDGCEPFAVPAGGIPLVDRGNCNFTVKVKNAQNAGAATAIVINNVAGPPTGMGGADPTITIPSVMISLDDGNLFKANLPLTLTLADGTGGAPDRDSDLDSGVIAHEYGHGISNRLTGGPATVSCLNNAEQMGEGWSDWFALNLTTHPADRPTTARGVGSYVIFEPPDGAGIRPTPYTTDMSVNPSTYASVADVVNISQPHGIGYVWNTMLWEVYWNLVDRHGYNADVYGDWTTGGNNLALQLVMDGLKFQVCRPGFVDGRNAILQADMALTAGANQCEIWRGFTKRGLGASADQGSSASRVDGVEAFDLPGICTAAVFGGFKPPVNGPPAVNTVNAGSTVPLKFTLSGAGSPLVIDSQPVDCTTLVPTGEAPQPLNTVGGTAPKGDRYHINWKTSGAWEGTCRRLTLRIPAAANAVAYFSFF